MSVSTILKTLGVLACLLIIAAILFPMFARSIGDRRHISCISCASNMKQIGLALTQYAQDNNDMMPNISDKSGNSTWRDATYPYIKSKGVYQCSERDLNDHDANPIGADGLAQSYAANYTGDYGRTQPDRGQGAFAGPDSKPISLGSVTSPAALITVMEAAYNPFPDYNIDDAHNFSPASRRFWAGHTGYSNYLFFDGHVKAMRPLDTYQQTNGKVIQNLWYRNGSQPLSANGVAVLQDAQTRFGG